MGISGLLPLLKSIHKPCHLKNFEGKTLGVDAYGWLHRGAVACAMELATGKPTKKFVESSMHRVRMLQHFGVIPFLVFDGDYLPSKAATEALRAKRRDEHRKIGHELLNAGKVSQSYLEFQKSLDITPEMARQLIDELRKSDVQYIVAPYEADCQLVYLESIGIIQGIISEDSDILVFGAKCLLTKLDQYGNCVEVNKSDFSGCKDINLAGWSDTAFRQMAILSGCDYLASIKNMGLKTAYRMVRKYKNIEKVIQMLKFDGKFHVPKDYLESFYQAELTFLHQRVFCPLAMGLVLHSQPVLPINLEKMTFIGAFIEPKIAQAVARGDLHPTTKLPITVSDSPQISGLTPWFNPHSKQSIADMKKGVSITRFFKKRTPLAELDPNSFTPSPIQQRILERNPRPWISSPINQPSFNRAASREYRSSLSNIGRDNQRNCPMIASTKSEFRSSKRARLCADTDYCLPLDSKITQTSPYFKSQLHKANIPSDIYRGDNQKKKQQNDYLFSDDSVEEAMLSIYESYDNLKTSKLAKQNLISEEDNHSNISEIHEKTIDTPISPADSAEYENSSPSPLKFSTKFDRLAHKPTKESLSSFSIHVSAYKFNHNISSSPESSARSLNSQTLKISSEIRQSKIPLAVQTGSHSQRTKTKIQRMTPLQRISTSATSRSKLLITPSNTPTHHAYGSDSSRNTFLENARSIISKSPEQTPELAKTHRTLLDEMEINFFNSSIGSEDLILHDSEEEPLSPINIGR